MNRGSQAMNFEAKRSNVTFFKLKLDSDQAGGNFKFFPTNFLLQRYRWTHEAKNMTIIIRSTDPLINLDKLPQARFDAVS